MRLTDLAAVGVMLVFGLTVFYYRRHSAVLLERKLHSARGSKLKSMEFLEEKGFKILDCDKSVEVISIVDNKSYRDALRVDFVVQKGPVKYLVRTVSGGQSPRLGYRENREPLIALSAIFGYSNLLLVDPERRNIRLMQTELKRSLPHRFNLMWKMAGVFLLGAFCAIIKGHLFP